ncbi:MAG: hypothetical protein PF542_05265 [Nanoarchaeota archaeon]|jgi:hypothetical protein|nr:hypothetical protein [Nanoarchaeota archaeon]
MKKQILIIVIALALLGALLIGINLNYSEDSTTIGYEFSQAEMPQGNVQVQGDNSIGEVYRAEKSKSSCPLSK